MRRPDKDTLKSLINSGFDIDLIAFELDVTIEDLKSYQLELGRFNCMMNGDEEEKLSASDLKFASQQIYKLRERYNLLCSVDSVSTLSYHKVATIVISEDEVQENESLIENIRKLLENGEGKSPDEKRIIAKDIYKEYKKIKLKNLTLEQASELYELLNHDVLKSFNRHIQGGVDYLVYNLESSKKNVVNVLFNLIFENLKTAETLEELEKLNEIAFKINDAYNKIGVSTIRGKITDKIRKLKIQAVIDEKKVVSNEIIEIVKQLVNGAIDINRAQNIIDVEAKKILENKDASCNTLEKSKKKIYDQIHAVLKENALEYPIECIEDMIKILSEFTGKEELTSARTIIMNLIGRKEYTRAKVVCEIYKGDDKKSDNYKAFEGLRQKVEQIEIGDIALKLIKGGTQEEEIAWFKKMDRAVRKEGINPKLIILGKNTDGKDIRLSSVLDDETYWMIK